MSSAIDSQLMEEDVFMEIHARRKLKNELKEQKQKVKELQDHIRTITHNNSKRLSKGELSSNTTLMSEIEINKSMDKPY